MEPGDLRINSRLRDDSGVSRNAPGPAYVTNNDANSVLQFRNHLRPAVITDGRIRHVHSPMAGPPLVIDRTEPVKIWRDPSLMNSSEVRHVVSMQHSGVVHLTHQHPMVAHTAHTGGTVYQHQHHDKSMDSTSRGPHNASDGLRGRTPVVFNPPASTAKPAIEAWRPGVLQNAKDFRVNVTSKSTVEQAVHDHFVESLRLAHLKGNAPQTIVKPEEQRPSSHSSGGMQRFYPPPPDKRHHEMPQQPVIYQMHPHQQLSKPELPAPPPLRSEPQYRTGTTMESGRKHQIYGAPEIIGRSHDTAQQSSIRYEQEPLPRLDVLPSENCVRYQKLPPAPRRPTAQSDLQLERNRSPFGKPGTPVASPNSYHAYPQTHISKHKVSSPAPPHIYGKPGPSPRQYDMGNDPSVPLPLTLKGGMTRPSQSSPSSYSHISPTLPQHDVRKSDVAYYMYNNGPPGFQPSMPPQTHIHSIQTQPLDLGGKRKIEDEAYKAHIQDYVDHTPIKTMYGSRKPVEHTIRPKVSPSQIQISNPVPLSLIVAETPPKRKIEDVSLSLHLDSKKVRSEPSITTNIMFGRKEHDLKPPVTGYFSEVDRMQSGNSAPISLTVSDSVIKVKTETQSLSVVVDARKSAINMSAVDTKPFLATPSPTICNGKHKEAGIENKIESHIIPKPDPEPTKINKVEASTSFITPATTTSPASKFQKVPKKAWVLQWHEGDNTKSSNDQNASNTKSASEPSISTSSSAANSSQSSTTPEKILTDESDGKLVNGHMTANETKAPTATNSQTLNGFGKERLNDSDIGSENESDNSNKDKTLTDSSTSPLKKNGRKGKDSGQASAKSDLRKDGLCKRPPVSQLKKTGESFIQAETCNRVTPKIGKCRECRWHPSGRGSKKQSGAYCRFYGFRKLRYTKGGSLTVAGFSDPFSDPSKITEHDQFRLWLPSPEAPEDLDVEVSKVLLAQLCDQFCCLVHQEEEARGLAHSQEMSVIAWKPLLKGVREMCDVCDTTLFNFHWACGKCGFVVCLSCFKDRKSESEETKMAENAGKDRDEFQWLLCSNRCAHELDKLVLVQTIAGNALLELNTKLHNVCSKFAVPQRCDCKLNNINFQAKPDVPATTEKSDGDASGIKEEVTKLLNMELLSKDASHGDNDAVSPKVGETKAVSDENSKTTKTPNGSSNCFSNAEDTEPLKNFKRLKTNGKIRISHTFKAFAVSESVRLYPSVKHSWLCDGKLLRLLDPQNSSNSAIFHEIWKRGQPIIVSNVTDKMDKSLWTPESFSKDFGDYKNDMINLMTGKIIVNQQMKKFWEGFSSLNKRLKDENGEPMLLKLKDWPQTDDFAQILPSRFQDLMTVLPLPEYTTRDGKLNLAARLPAEFMKPDLGPKMYIAYGSELQVEKGTTNLHLDASDTVNLLVHCEALQNGDASEHEKAVLNAIEESDCDVVTINRVVQQKEVPGALWHVYDAKDADKIRDLLNKVAIENGTRVEPRHDAIHDESWYLDRNLRKRLRAEYSVSGYTILQCAGDAIFIPAGAPRQVRNLQNCIKVAEDFVSPENISDSLYLTEDCRNAEKGKINYEDKLQIKNIVYHAVKDAITVLLLESTDKSENSESTSKDKTDASPAFSKDCQFQPSTSPKDSAAVVVSTATN